VSTDERVRQIRAMVDEGDYFCISRGRQYGKTITLFALEGALSDAYGVINLDFQAKSTEGYSTEGKFGAAFCRILWRKRAKLGLPPSHQDEVKALAMDFRRTKQPGVERMGQGRWDEGRRREFSTIRSSGGVADSCKLQDSLWQASRATSAAPRAGGCTIDPLRSGMADREKRGGGMVKVEGPDRGREGYAELLASLRPIDDAFMRMVFRDCAEATQAVLRAVTGIGDLEVVQFETQRDERRAGIRSAELDVLARDSEGRAYDMEVQLGEALDPKRCRYYGSLMDVGELAPGRGFDALPERWVIFLMEGDPRAAGRATYHFQYRDGADGGLLGDETHVLAVNGAWRGNDEVGRVMHDMLCSDPDEMLVGEIRERVKYLKEAHVDAQGKESAMNPVVEKYRQMFLDEGREEGLKEGHKEGRKEGREEALVDCARVMREHGLDVADVLAQLGATAEERERLAQLV
jgi:hypothetical protein